MGDIDLLWLAVLLLWLLHWVTLGKIARLRETLRRHNIVHDEKKPWEGA